LSTRFSVAVSLFPQAYGVSGPLNFIAAGEPGEATIEVYSYDKSGKLQSVKTVQSRPVG